MSVTIIQTWQTVKIVTIRVLKDKASRRKYPLKEVPHVHTSLNTAHYHVSLAWIFYAEWSNYQHPSSKIRADNLIFGTSDPWSPCVPLAIAIKLPEVPDLKAIQILNVSMFPQLWFIFVSIF